MYKEAEQMFKLASWVDAHSGPLELATDLRTTNLGVLDWFRSCTSGSQLSWLCCQAYRHQHQEPNVVHRALAVFALSVKDATSKNRPKAYQQPMQWASRCLELYVEWMQAPGPGALADLAEEAEKVESWLWQQYRRPAMEECPPPTTTETSCTLYLYAVCQICEALPRPANYWEVPGYSIAGTMAFCFTNLAKALVANGKHTRHQAEWWLAMTIKGAVPLPALLDTLEQHHQMGAVAQNTCLPPGWARVQGMQSLEDVFLRAHLERARLPFASTITTQDLEQLGSKRVWQKIV